MVESIAKKEEKVMGFVNEKTEDGKWQTIDRERNIILRKIGGGMPQVPMDFSLDVNGQEFKFQAFQHNETLKNGYHVKWRVVKIYAPVSLKLKKDEIHQLIEEALHGYGFASSHQNVETLTVTFISRLLEA